MAYKAPAVFTGVVLPDMGKVPHLVCDKLQKIVIFDAGVDRVKEHPCT
jgi:hypothetical protein